MSVIDVGSCESFGFSKDPIVVRLAVGYIKGGKVLDVDGFTEETIKAGHIIIRDTETKETYKPLPVKDGAYESLPSGYEYVGVVAQTVPATEPIVSILYNGEVNVNACPFEMTSDILTAMKTAIPTLVFEHD